MHHSKQQTSNSLIVEGGWVGLVNAPPQVTSSHRLEEFVQVRSTSIKKKSFSQSNSNNFFRKKVQKRRKTNITLINQQSSLINHQSFHQLKNYAPVVGWGANWTARDSPFSYQSIQHRPITNRSGRVIKFNMRERLRAYIIPYGNVYRYVTRVFGSFLPKNFFRVVRFEIGWYQNDRKPK
jgi:hypothetical protein